MKDSLIFGSAFALFLEELLGFNPKVHVSRDILNFVLNDPSVFILFLSLSFFLIFIIIIFI